MNVVFFRGERFACIPVALPGLWAEATVHALEKRVPRADTCADNDESGDDDDVGGE